MSIVIVLNTSVSFIFVKYSPKDVGVFLKFL